MSALLFQLYVSDANTECMPEDFERALHIARAYMQHNPDELEQLKTELWSHAILRDEYAVFLFCVIELLL